MPPLVVEVPISNGSSVYDKVKAEIGEHLEDQAGPEVKTEKPREQIVRVDRM